jgi:hypothetical protein
MSSPPETTGLGTSIQLSLPSHVANDSIFVLLAVPEAPSTKNPSTSRGPTLENNNSQMHTSIRYDPQSQLRL